MIRCAAVVLVSACLACSSVAPKMPAGIGVIPDDSLRSYLVTLDLVGDAVCSARTQTGGRVAYRCRAFETLDAERLIGVYDRITDEILVLIYIEPDGRQVTIWQRERAERENGDGLVTL